MAKHLQQQNAERIALEETIAKTSNQLNRIRNKSIFFIIFSLVLALCSCNDNDELIDADPVYNDFPSHFEIPPEGGQFTLRQGMNNNYELHSCSTYSVLRNSDKQGDVTLNEEKVEKNDSTIVGTDGKEFTYTYQYFCSWFNIRKENVKEITLTVAPNQTGHKRIIDIRIWSIPFPGMPTGIYMEQKSE